MEKTKSIARLIEQLVPGLSLIILGLFCYFFVRHFSPASTEVASLIYFVSNAGGVVLMASGALRWLRERADPVLEETPEARRGFCANIRTAVNLPPEPETELFIKLAMQATRRHSPPAYLECWSYDMKMPGDQPYKVKVYFALHDGRFGIAMVYGLPGAWNESYFLAGEYDQEGSLITLRRVYGDFRAAGESGTRIIFQIQPGSSPVIKLMSMSVGELTRCDLPPVLKPHFT